MCDRERKQHSRAVVRPVAEAAELLLAVTALSARNLERRHDALAGLQVRYIRSNSVNDTHELVSRQLKFLKYSSANTYLMSKNITLLQRQNLTMEQMQIRTTDRRPSNFNHNVVLSRQN